jgi:hypothetical protein
MPVSTKKEEAFKLSLRIALTSAALASVGHRCTMTELATIVGCYRATIRKNADLCDAVLSTPPALQRARIAEAIDILSKLNQQLTYSAIAAIAGCGTTTIQRNRDLWEHVIPKKSCISIRDSKKLAPQSKEIWRERVRNLVSLDSDSLQLKERQGLQAHLSWFASFAPTPADTVWCNDLVQSLERHEAPEEAIAN